MSPSLRKICAYWISIFLLIMIACEFGGHTNALSRYACLLSMSENHTFSIDPYVALTVDWSRSPNGHYYSNKAPGAAFLAFPVFWTIDHLTNMNLNDPVQRFKRREVVRFQLMKFLSILLQALPFTILSFLIVGTLQQRGISQYGLTLTLIALLFGHTSSLLMNTFYGHALAAALIMGMIFATLKQKWFWAGLCVGFGALTDYSVLLFALTFPLLLWSPRDKRTGRNMLHVLVGAILPALLWTIYHTRCFGGPFVLATHFNNPRFVEAGKGIAGQFALIPPPEIIAKLLFGSHRGILWTQPWVLLVITFGIAALLRSKKSGRWSLENRLFLFSFLSLSLLIWFNAGFGGWHGGNLAGPRYLSSIFPVFAVLLAFYYDGLHQAFKLALWASVLFSVLFFIVVYSTHLDPDPTYALWPHYLNRILINPTRTSVIRLCGMVILFVTGTLFTLKNLSKKETSISV